MGGGVAAAGEWQWQLHHCEEQLSPELGLDDLVAVYLLSTLRDVSSVYNYNHEYYFIDERQGMQ